MDVSKYIIDSKEATLHRSGEPDSPLIVFNNFSGDGSDVAEELGKLSSKPFNLLSISGLKWDDEMSPWFCPPVFKGDTPYAGEADKYLDILTREIIPKALGLIHGKPAHLGIAGYSLAGLFAIYALYRTGIFDRAASMSGSMWFPEFKDFATSHPFAGKPEKIYLSLGDKESRTKNPYLSTVQENTEALADHYRSIGIDVTWELNPGNHFVDATQRCAKGILSIL